jgi:CRISPR system Cascade subunit CasB
MTPARESPHEHPFVGYLLGLAKREDRGALAALRRGLGKPPGTAPEMHPYVAPWLSPGMPPWEEDALYTLAALFGTHPHHAAVGNLGASFRRVSSKTESESIEKRFIALLACHADDLPELLRQAISLAKSKEVPIDYNQLLHDIPLWGHPDRFVQREWARAFWSPSGKEQKAQADPESATPVTSD